MKAAVVTTFGEAPRYTDAPDPSATRENELVVDILAAALAPRVRSQAAGSHYSGAGELPLIPGIDGVGRRADGRLVYFVLPDTNRGSFAERALVDRRRSVLLPEGADPVAIAAAMNPVMASWVALRRRITFRNGQSVMILGATGSAGRATVQVAHRLGAGDIITVGRGADRMRDLLSHGATGIVDLAAAPKELERDLAAASSQIDVVLDFLWGEPTRTALTAIVPHRARDEQPLTWIQIGSVAGLDSPVPAAALRAINLRLIGSGQGSVEPGQYREEIEDLAREIHSDAFDIPARAVPLAEVETTWAIRDRGPRIVFTP